MKLDENFNQQDFTEWIEEFLPDFSIDIRKVDVPGGFTGVKAINTLGESGLNVRVYIIETDADPSRRKVGLATDSFSLLKNYGSPNAIIAYYSKDEPLWRISLLTSTPVWSEGRIITKLSNPKRQSYVLGSKAKIKTPHQYLLSKGKIIDFADLKSRFSLEVVNKEFYKEISQAFTKLVGGLLKLPSTQDRSQTNLEFAVRLIGRIIFCWFLREKRSTSGHSLMPRELVSFDGVNNSQDYYHKILEPIFFEILNKPIRSRKETFINGLFSAIPYLNGGLFSPHEDDFFNYNEEKQAINHNTVVIPNEWLKSFFEVLETYNFTIDENTSFDEELSIDPEMLGRIFENLLAEINPETGESARKSTGSYYTPRIIVDYMIDESLLLYLKEKAGIEENKLRSLISYDLEDDKSNPLNEDEKDRIAQALGSIKILDPACGSGAFPIGALQKIVFILQQIDENGQLWFKKQIQNTPVELRKVIEREFNEKNFDYIRKLGIIRENIYGIDIQPIATEISRLRCFLTLVVDQSVKDDEENRGVEPLPNLDFKFVTANSLIGLPKIKLDQQELFDDNAKIDELKSLRDQYFTARNEERKDIMIAFSELQSEMINELIDKHLYTGAVKAELTRKLTDWKPFKHKSTDWFDPEWMFGIKDGFDVVIGNPPYYSISKLEKIHREYLKKEYKEIHSGYNDLMYYFVFRGVQMLNTNGILGMITSNYYLGNSYSKLFRKFLAKHILKLINFKKYMIFKEASVHTNIIFASKNNIIPDVTFFEFDSINEELNGQIELQCSYFKILRHELGAEWLIANNDNAEIIIKLYFNSCKLGDIANILKGATSGNRKIFTVTKEFAKENNLETSLLKNSINSMDIQRYILKDSGKTLIYTDDETEIDNFPNMEKYLLTFKNELIKRNEVKKGSYPWFRLERPRDKYVFESQKKLVVPYRSEYNNFAFDDQQGYNDGGGSYAIALKEQAKINILFVLGILNSTLMNWYYGFIGKPKGKVREYFNEPLSKIPIHIIKFDNPSDKETHDNLVELVAQMLDLQLIIQSDRSEAEKISSKHKAMLVDQQINELVYDLYGLTRREIAIVEGSSN